MRARRWIPGWQAAVLAAVVATTAALVRGAEPAASPLLQAVPQAALRAAAAPDQVGAAAADPAVVRLRYVTIDFDALPRTGVPGLAPATGGELALELFDGDTVSAVFDRFEPNPFGVTWIGRLPGVPDSYVAFAYGGGTLAGRILLPGRSFVIRPSPAGADPAAGGVLHELVEVNPDGLPREGEPIPVEFSGAEPAAAADVPMADDPVVIDVLVLFTPTAAAAAGGSGIANAILLSVADTNTAYANSGVDQRIRLVGLQQVEYTEVNSLSTNLTNLRSGLAGLGGVAAMRDAFGADLVALIVRPPAPDFCGIAYLMTNVSPAFASSGFSVTHAGCLTGFTFGHELGHNMGLRHDWFVDGAATPYTYAHGYVSPAGQFRTIMAYPDHCTALGIGCPRVLAFSNPDLVHQGHAMGVPGGTRSNCTTRNVADTGCDADERRALNNTAATVASFRQAPDVLPPIIVSHPQSAVIARGQVAILHVEAAGTGPLAYQWFRGTSPNVSSPMPGAHGPTLAVTPGEGGIWAERINYWVRVSNSAGATDSLPAMVVLTTAAGDLVQNGDFSQGLAGWWTVALPDASHVAATVVDGVAQFRAFDTPSGRVSRGGLLQPTGQGVASGTRLVATFELGNSGTARRRLRVLLFDRAGRGAEACTFVLDPGLPLTPFRMVVEPPDDWTDTVIYFEGTSAPDGGDYLLRAVSLSAGGGSGAAGAGCGERLQPGARPRPADPAP